MPIPDMSVSPEFKSRPVLYVKSSSISTEQEIIYFQRKRYLIDCTGEHQGKRAFAATYYPKSGSIEKVIFKIHVR